MRKLHTKRYFNGMPIVDARKELRVFVTKEDIALAIRKNPARCAFSNACRRAYESESVVFFRTVAYVGLPDGKGGRHIERFALGKDTSRQIIKFDRTGKASPDGYVLSPPATTSSLNYRLQACREYSASGRRKELDQKRTEKRNSRRKTMHESTDVRNGTGLVKFMSHENRSIQSLLTAATS